MVPSGAFGGTRATYVAISSVSILALALLVSIWQSDVSGSIALLGLLSVYMSSSELLMLFLVLTPISVIVDIIRLTGPHVAYTGRGWLIFFSIAEILAKAAGSIFAWSLYRSIAAGEGAGTYQPISTQGGGGGGGMAAAAMERGNAGGAQGGPPPSAYTAQPQGDNPFSSYAPPRSDGLNGGSNTYQPFPQSTQPHL